jgi:hypothetical protein
LRKLKIVEANHEVRILEERHLVESKMQCFKA